MDIDKKEMEAVKAAYKALDDKFAEDIKVLSIGKISPIADYFIIATGKNPNQIAAMVSEVDANLYKCGLKLDHSEGLQTANWVLLDFGSIIIHIFDKENRNFYNLERIWGDAEVIKMDEVILTEE